MNAKRRLAAIPALVAVLASLFGSAPVGTASVRPPCHAAVREGSLPIWARGGFHPPTQQIPHVLGRSRAIVAILFAQPLQAPPPLDHNNKILWVSRIPVESVTRLRISAQRMNGTVPLGTPVRRSVAGGPGPSIIDLPAPGCWRLSLTWAGRADSLDLQYRPRQ